MAPAFAVQDEAVALLLNLEGRRQQMALAEGATDLEFLTDGERLLRTNDLQFPDTPALATLKRDEFLDLTEVFLQLAADELRELCLRVFDSPAVD